MMQQKNKRNVTENRKILMVSNAEYEESICKSVIKSTSIYRKTTINAILPHVPFLKRSGTWIKCAEFLSNNFTDIKNILIEFDVEVFSAIKTCIDIFKKKSIIKK